MRSRGLPTRVSNACDRCRRQKQRVSSHQVQYRFEVAPDRKSVMSLDLAPIA